MNKRITRVFAVLLVAIMMLGILPTSALAADETTIGTSDNADLFEYQNDSGWHDLSTPKHWDRTTNDVAYCLEHEKDSPPTGESYTPFDPAAVYNSTTRKGIQAILSNGYPVKDGGLSNDAARYATANALRAWLKESADIGYNFMDVSNGRVRAKSGQSAAWNFMMSLLNKARDGAGGSSTGGTVSVSPNPAEWKLVNGQLETTLNITASDGYSITNKPSNVSISGFQGDNSDKLTVTAPLSFANQTTQIIFQGADGEDTAKLYWYEPQSSSYQPIVVVDLVPGEQGQKATVSIKGEFYLFTLHKVDTHTGAAIDGAVFELRQGGNAVGLTKTANGKYMYGGSTTQFTTSGGTALVEYLPEGSYQLVEVSGPSAGYIISGNINVSLTGNKDVTVENKPTELHIQKTDKLTGATMPNVEFRLKNASGQVVKLAKVKDGEYKPDNNGADTFKLDIYGKVGIYYLPQGQYTVEELPLAGFADLPAQSVTVGTSPATVKIDNDPLTFRLVKTDSHTDKPMPNVKFNIIDASGKIVKLASMGNGAYKPDSNGSDTFSTWTDGSATIYYLPKGSYTIREAEPVPSYAIPDEQKITITGSNGMGNPVRIGVENEPLTLEFEKTDALTGEYLDGAVFRLLDESGNVVKLAKEKDGEYKPDNNGADIFTTKNGKAVIRYLTVQKYTIVEVSAPPAFMPDVEKPFTLTWQNGTSNPIKQAMKDEPLTLEFTKLDSFTNLPMDGALFQLLNEKGDIVKLSPFQNKAGYYKDDPNGKDTFTTSGGKATIYYLPVSSYTVVEVKAAPTYAPALDRKTNITIQNGFSNPAKLTMRDEPLMLEVRKKDSNTGQPIGGVLFRLEDEDGNLIKLSPITGKDGYYKPDENGNETFMIPPTGIAKILYLPYQVYKIVEEKSAAGFSLSGEEAVITLRQHNGMSDPARMDVKNVPLQFELYKMDKLTGAPVSGAVFRLLDQSGNVVKLTKQPDGSYKPDSKGSETFTVGAGGKATVKYIPVGKYTVEELTCAGYGIAAPQGFEIAAANSADNPTKLTIEDIPLEFELYKVDKLTKEPLASVPFRLLDEKGNIVKLAKQPDGSYRPDDKGSETFITGKDGKATVRYIPVAKYIVEELEFAGYGIAVPQGLEINVGNVSGNPAKLTFENIPTELIIEKQDSTTKEALTGATFRLLDEQGKAIKVAMQENGSYRPDEQGADTFTLDETARASITHLPAQKLAIEEVTAPAGYGLEEKQEVVLTAGNTVEAPVLATIKDNPLALEIYKVHGQTKKPLSGAGFAIKEKGALDKPLTFTLTDGIYRYDPDGKDSTIMVDKDGKAVVYGLPVSDYVLEETVVPDKFFPAPPQNFTVGIDNDIENAVNVTVANEPFVKLGEDTDRNRLWIGVALLVLSLGGGVFVFLRRKKK